MSRKELERAYEEALDRLNTVMFGKTFMIHKDNNNKKNKTCQITN